MIYFPFDNASSTNLDRNVSSDVYADYMAMFFRNGVHPEDSTYFQVYSEEIVDQMTLQVKIGLAIINGRFAMETDERTLIVQASEAQDRIDSVVLRLDLSLRTIDLYVVKGTAGSSPVAPTPTRAGDVYELVLAHVYINATSTTITNDKITDTRLNSDLCGVIAGTVEEVDTTAIFDQYQAALDAFLAIVQSAIDETMYGQLVDMIDLKQDLLVSGTNIKTVGGESLLGSGDIPLVRKNWIINGGFDVWQRGTSQTTAGYGSDDRWKNDQSVSTKTHSQQTFTVGQTDVPNNPTYFSRTVVTSGGTSSSHIYKNQAIENVTKLAGKTISLSFWAKADATKNISIEFAQVFGTSGSTAVTDIGIQKISLTNSWQRFTKIVTLPSTSGKTIGLGSYTLLSFWFDAGSDFNSRTNSLGNQSGTFDIANVSLVEGSVPVEWQTEAYADVLRQCQRYYWRIYPETQIYLRIFMGSAATNINAYLHCQFPVEMRISPTSVEYLNLALWDGISVVPFSSMILVADSKSKQNAFVVTTGTGLTAFRTYYFIVNNTLNGYLAFNAEL